MKRSLRWCVGSLRFGGLALTLAACSSTPAEVSHDAGGTSNDAGDVCPALGNGGPVNGTGMTCPTQTSVAVAMKLTLSTTWPQTVAVLMGPAAGESGRVSIWLLSTYTVDSNNKMTGKTKTCGNQTPPITLTAFAMSQVQAPAGTHVQIDIPRSVWNAPTMPSTPVTGALGGWNVGSSFSVDPVVTLSGLKPTSTLAQAMTPWPGPSTNASMDPAVPATDIADDDGDGKPGITATALNDGTIDFAPRTALSATAPQVDKLYVVLRTALSLYGTTTSCTDGCGTATVSLLNNHVVGCHVPSTAMDCTPTEYNFIDSNTTAYVVMSGTYRSKQLTAGSAATCDDVLNALS